MPFFVWQIHHLFFVILFLETESALKNLVASIDGEGKKYFFFWFSCHYECDHG
jgi:hypothetical protein